jgi:preprotein translocase subunit SecY
VLQTLKNAWRIPELRKKIMFTLIMLLVYRAGSFIPVPGIDLQILNAQLSAAAGTLFDFYDILSGGNFGNFTIFALNISPYITASIIIQLLTIVIPKLEQLSKEGEEGRRKITQYMRYGTIVLALIQAIGMSLGLFRGAIRDDSFLNVTVIVLTLTAGTAFVMWLGELITERGIGNGISLIIFAGIVSRIPAGMFGTLEFQLGTGGLQIFNILFFLIITLATIVAIILIDEGKRKIPVQYAKRVVGRKMYGGQSTHIPLKVNQSGVIPIIFAMALLSFPQTIALFFNQDTARRIASFTEPGSFLGTSATLILVIFFTYFYTAVTFNPIEVADNMKKHGGFIPGIRPGRPTSDHLQRVLTRITLAGAVFLGVIAVLPAFVQRLTGIQSYLGGTSIIIVVGVALETMKQIEAQLLMRHYEGFLK